MDEKLKDLMSVINSHIINDTPLNKAVVERVLIAAAPNVEFSTDKKSLAKLNKYIFQLREDLKDLKKKEKALARQIGTLSEAERLELFQQFEKYIYDIIETPDYKSKNRNKKVYLGYLENIWGHGLIDETGRWKGNTEDIFQEGRMYLWEVLQRFGKRPDKRKNFKERDRQGDKNSKSSASTFAYGSVARLFINLGKSCVTVGRTGSKPSEASGDKDNRVNYLRPTIVEYDPEITESYYSNTKLPNMEFHKEEYKPNIWKKVCKELNVPHTASIVKTLEGEVLWS